VILDVATVAALLAIGNIVFWRFEPRKPLWRRLLKVFAALLITVAISQYAGRIGVVIAIGIAALPVIYIHAIWLPRNGVNGWTAEPREKYYALRGWTRPDK
jgi:uncharacterized membrane protein